MSILQSVKKHLFFLKYAVVSVFLRLRGVCVGRRCIISGWPVFFRCRGSVIRIGNNAVLHSRKKYNALITSRMVLATLEPGAVIEIGDHCGLSGSKIVCACKVSLGSYTIVGPDTLIYDCKEHEYSPETGWLNRTRRTGKPVCIGKRCYIGTKCIILKGVHIGDDCVIAAGTVVTKDVPSGHLASGNPAVYTPLPARLQHPQKRRLPVEEPF